VFFGDSRALPGLDGGDDSIFLRDGARAEGVFGNGGNDHIVVDAGAKADSVWGYWEGNFVEYYSNKIEVFGDVVRVFGANGPDNIVVGDGGRARIVYGGSGDDTIDILSGAHIDQFVEGADGDDKIFVSTDAFVGFAIDGGQGVDTCSKNKKTEVFCEVVTSSSSF